MNPAKSTHRIYLVRHTDTGAERLIRASTAAQARNYAARDTIAVDVANQEQLVSLLTGAAPVSIENAAQREDEIETPAPSPAPEPPAAA